MSTSRSRVFGATARSATVLFLLFALLLPINAAYTLDPTFNGTGKVTVDFPNPPATNYTSQAFRVFVQPSGRILLGGSFTSGTADGQLSGVAWAGLTTGGTLDGGFGSGGKVTEWRSDGSSNMVDALMYPDGAFLHIAQFFRLPVGSSTVYASRYSAAGSGDSVFGSNSSIGPCCFGFFNARPVQIAVRPDGKVLALITDQGELQLYRLNPDGTRDTTFGNNGVLGIVFNRFSVANFVEMIALNDGKVLLVGHVAPFDNSSGSSELFFARLTETGNWDKTFGRLGTLRVPVADGMTGRVRKAILQPDGKILLSGYVASPDHDVWMARFRGNGKRDTTFGNNGVVIHDFASGDTDAANSIAVGSDGKIRIGGLLGTTPKFLVARFSSTGTFEDHTTFEFTAGQAAVANDVALQPDGKVVVAGFTRNPNASITGNVMAVARLGE